MKVILPAPPFFWPKGKRASVFFWGAKRPWAAVGSGTLKHATTGEQICALRQLEKYHANAAGDDVFGNEVEGMF